MAIRGECGRWISRIHSGGASFAPALAVALVLGLFGANSAQAQTFTTLYNFTGGADGKWPWAVALVRNTAGTLYGTTIVGGENSEGHEAEGVVFKVDTTGKETLLYTFVGGYDGG